MPHPSVRPLRYVVEFWDHHDTVGYNCGLGNDDARSWALATAVIFGGKVILQFSDGSSEVIRSFGTPAPRGQDVNLETLMNKTSKEESSESVDEPIAANV